ncbi:hypothetical protein T02_13365 [Trichinella nativa]|uniref:Uncharacterized protein n=1 Tax=Trichinella nativa TaxID=6335 RepID=A0A0V1KMS4_9BILA|nr:hypothetical protein T02_13365 [Trichinella nativa]
MLFQGPSLRLAVARTERELKQLRNGQPGESSLQRHPCRIYSRRRVTEARNPDEDEQNFFCYTEQRSNREAAQAQHPRVQPMESILQRDSCRIHFRKRKSWARHHAEDKWNVFRYTG